MKSLTRRRFLHSSGIVVGAVLLPQFKSTPNALRLGGPIFLKSDDPVELAKEHRRLGYSAAYVPKVELKDTPRIAALRKAFAAQNVIIAEVGAWVNMLDADAEKRKKNMAYVTERLALAEEIGALTCIDIAGSYNPKHWDGPDARNLTKEYFDATVENCRKVIDAVKPKTAKFALEMMGWSLPNDADSCLKFIKAIDRPAFAAHVDIANIINSPERFYQNTALINDTFKKLGKWIVSCHAKDVVGKDVHFAETMPGRGGMDYATYLRNVTALPREVPLMLEHLRTPEEYDEARLYVMKMAKDTGIPLA
ncbi:sugar phosphate isomerase/epimerase family protein [Runella salmonicolor]|uniref:Sugar phosphate isomerase/epimerase n=1 Tax=Runella salmonicolor TaxID=2950278 RepID=A0ABT1FPJ9_9BACT|nr:sugar phosphate isomerase/epimerase [Runella salmonicolor]MCP1383420.1 sugar phosphate isomerase/epimerase [Runella salmonicolor]